MEALELGFEVVELASFSPEGWSGEAAGGGARPVRELEFPAVARKDGWTLGEVDTVRRMFRADAGLEEIADELGRPLYGVRSKIYTLGLRRNTHRPWNELEDEYMEGRYGIDAASEIGAALGRTPLAVLSRAKTRGLTEPKEPPYTDWERLQVRQGYRAGVAVGHVAALIGRGSWAVSEMARQEGLRHPAMSPGWTHAEQSEALRLADEGLEYAKVAARLAAAGFARRTGKAVGMALRGLGYGRGWGRPWQPEEEDLLRHAYRTGGSLVPLQRRIARTADSIRWKAKEMGLQGSHPKKSGWRTEPPYSEAEIALLRSDYPTPARRTLPERLGRTKGSVYNMAYRLGVGSEYFRRWEPDEDKGIAIGHALGLALKDVAEALRRDNGLVGKRAIQMGIRYSDRPKPEDGRGGRHPGLTLARLLEMGVEQGTAGTPHVTPETKRQGRPPGTKGRPR